LEAVAAISAACGRARPAAHLLGWAEATLADIGATRPARDAASLARTRAAVRSSLTADAFAQSLAEGKGLSLEAIVAEALAEAEVASGLSAPEIALPSSPLAALSPREFDVLRLLAGGLSNKEIAARLGLAPRTAANHVAAVLAKLGVPSRTAAAAIAVRNGIV